MLDTVFPIERLEGGKPHHLTLEADAHARTAIAERFSWLELSSLKAEIMMKKIAAGAYHVSGHIEAHIIQNCRLTGEAVPERLVITVDERFVEAVQTHDVMEIDPLATSVDIIEGNMLPLGEMIAQLTGLEASLWPETKDAQNERTIKEELHSADDKIKPFASLAELKKKI